MRNGRKVVKQVFKLEPNDSVIVSNPWLDVVVIVFSKLENILVFFCVDGMNASFIFPRELFAQSCRRVILLLRMPHPCTDVTGSMGNYCCCGVSVPVIVAISCSVE